MNAKKDAEMYRNEGYDVKIVTLKARAGSFLPYDYSYLLYMRKK